MIKHLHQMNEAIDTSSNHVCEYQLISQTDDYEVIKKNIKKDSLTIIQKEECAENTNTYYILSGKIQLLYSNEIYGPGSSMVFRDIEETVIFLVLEDSEILWIAKKSVYDGLAPENNAIMDTLDQIQDKDHYTKEHSLRVANLAKKLALSLKLPGREISNLTIAALAHDLGKIDIDDHILNKPGRLTDEEFEIIKKHVDFSYEKVKSSLPEGVTEIIIQHHERLDGSGYPNGLKGDDICYSAKILAVVDSYDAMSTERPYKKALAKDLIIEELMNCIDTHYDEQICKHFIEIIKHDS